LFHRFVNRETSLLFLFSTLVSPFPSAPLVHDTLSTLLH
jgi:hypothetical protein